MVHSCLIDFQLCFPPHSLKLSSSQRKMRLATLAAAICVVGGPAFARPTSLTESYELFRSLPQIPKGFELDKSNIPSPDVKIRLRIHMKEGNRAEFDQRFADISTPGHAQYGQFMTTHAIQKMLKPKDDTLDAVMNWITDFGLRSQTEVKDEWVYIDAKLSEVENLLQTKYEYFRRTDGKGTVLRTTRVNLPKRLHDHIQMIAPTTYFGHVSAMRSMIYRYPKEQADAQMRKQDDSVVNFLGEGENDINVRVCNVSEMSMAKMTPKCLIDLYNIDTSIKPTAAYGTYGIAGYLEEYAQVADLNAFYNAYKSTNVFKAPLTFKFQGIKGGNDTSNQVLGINTQYSGYPTNDDTEANLDIQYATGLTSPMQVVYYQTGGRPTIIQTNDNILTNDGKNSNEPYLDWINYMLTLDDDALPHTVSTSYGEPEQSVPLDYATSVCNGLKTLGGKGVSVLFSSGDGGAGGTSAGSCVDQQTKKDQFQATFPASCPWVTGVGGTHQIEPENAVSFSGGGFSKYWPIQDYQKVQQKAWQQTDDDKKTPGVANITALYNAEGRGTPDVAAQGLQFDVFVNRQSAMGGVSGTSASAPTFGSVIAMVNGNLKASGKAPLGFLNPWLYGTAAKEKGLTDITDGQSSVGCECRGDKYADDPDCRRPKIAGVGW